MNSQQVRAEARRLDALVNEPALACVGQALEFAFANEDVRWDAASDRSRTIEEWSDLVEYMLARLTRSLLSERTAEASQLLVAGVAVLAKWHAAIAEGERCRARIPVALSPVDDEVGNAEG